MSFGILARAGGLHSGDLGVELAAEKHVLSR